MAYDKLTSWFSPQKIFSGGKYPWPLTSALKAYPEIRAEIQKIIKRIGARKILEIGPGDQPLVDAPGTVYLDVVSGFLHKIRGYRVQGDVRFVPFQDEAFDLVVAADVLCHVPPQDRTQAVKEIMRLAPKALVFNPEASTIYDRITSTKEMLESIVPTEVITETLRSSYWNIEKRYFSAPFGNKSYQMSLIFGEQP